MCDDIPERDDVKAFSSYLESIGYLFVMHCDGVYSALMPLLYTTAICSDIEDHCFAERYCFEIPEKALEQLLLWREVGFSDDFVVTGQLATRFVKRPAQLAASNAVTESDQ